MSISWAFITRVVAKTIVLVALCNFAFALVPPDAVSQLSWHNRVVPGRERFAIGERGLFAQTTYDLPALFASHKIARNPAPPADEYRVVLIGDSATWGFLLQPDETYAATITRSGTTLTDGRQVVAYNLAYQQTSGLKDLLILQEAMHYQPDRVVWLVTLRTFQPRFQRNHALVNNNPELAQALIDRHALDITLDDDDLIPPVNTGTLYTQRERLSTHLRLQLYGVPWALLRVDHIAELPDEPLDNDFSEDVTWAGFDDPTNLTADDLNLDLIAAAEQITGDVPLLIINEPIYVADGDNSDLHYNSFYPRWAYDSYRTLLADRAAASEWRYADLWDVMPASDFTDTPLHLNAQAAAEFSDQLLDEILKLTTTD